MVSLCLLRFCAPLHYNPKHKKASHACCMILSSCQHRCKEMWLKQKSTTSRFDESTETSLVSKIFQYLYTQKAYVRTHHSSWLLNLFVCVAAKRVCVLFFSWPVSLHLCIDFCKEFPRRILRKESIHYAIMSIFVVFMFVLVNAHYWFIQDHFFHVWCVWNCICSSIIPKLNFVLLAHSGMELIPRPGKYQICSKNCAFARFWHFRRGDFNIGPVFITAWIGICWLERQSLALALFYLRCEGSSAFPYMSVIRQKSVSSSITRTDLPCFCVMYPGFGQDCCWIFICIVELRKWSEFRTDPLFLVPTPCWIRNKFDYWNSRSAVSRTPIWIILYSTLSFFEIHNAFQKANLRN